MDRQVYLKRMREHLKDAYLLSDARAATMLPVFIATLQSHVDQLTALAENGDLPEALFDSCPACKTEWAFDFTGHIYPCTATVGKVDESLGTFYPEVSRKETMIENWESRDVLSIPECKECFVQLACGGGCGAIAKNRAGNICSPDCRPVKELMELGFAAYFEDL